MQFDQLSQLWQAYRVAEIDRTLHASDKMNAQHRGDWQKYNFVGESAAKTIYSALTVAPVENVGSVLDFGCGYGRVARHLRAMFGDATIYFSDIDAAASTFCADTFVGKAVPAVRDFSALRLPGNLDLIWVGSVFTHISADRMQQLFDVLFDSLASKGILVATFHGEQAILFNDKREPLIHPPFWQKILEQYRVTGIGHHPYGGANGIDNWGISLSRPDRVIDLGKNRNAIPFAYLPQAWANLQDVAVWGRI